MCTQTAASWNLLHGWFGQDIVALHILFIPCLAVITYTSHAYHTQAQQVLQSLSITSVFMSPEPCIILIAITKCQLLCYSFDLLVVNRTFVICHAITGFDPWLFYHFGIVFVCFSCIDSVNNHILKCFLSFFLCLVTYSFWFSWIVIFSTVYRLYTVMK